MPFGRVALLGLSVLLGPVNRHSEFTLFCLVDVIVFRCSYDRAFALEQMALAGFRVYDIIDAACAIFKGANPIDVENALRVGGPAYLADCYRKAHGYHW